MQTVNLRGMGTDPTNPTAGPLVGTADVNESPSLTLPQLLTTHYDEHSVLVGFEMTHHARQGQTQDPPHGDPHQARGLAEAPPRERDAPVLRPHASRARKRPRRAPVPGHPVWRLREACEGDGGAQGDGAASREESRASDGGDRAARGARRRSAAGGLAQRGVATGGNMPALQ